MMLTDYRPYIPTDRFAAILQGGSLPTVTSGAVLFSDISGFTPLTQKLQQTLGARQGAEVLTIYLNQIYSGLIDSVHRYGGSVVTFSGDAITCLFAGDTTEMALRAVVCAFALQHVIQAASDMTLPNGETIPIGLKTAVATGNIHRYVVGDPRIQFIDTLAGETVTRTAIGERLIARGELIIDEITAMLLKDHIVIKEWREHIDRSERYAVLSSVQTHIEAVSASTPNLDPHKLDVEQLRSWLLPDVFSHLQAGLGHYLTELRPATALFVNFSSIDYETDPDAGDKLDQFFRFLQHVMIKHGGNVLQLTIGDKGSYIYAAFGAPIAHEDDVERALRTALELRDSSASSRAKQTLKIGIGQGLMRTGTYGSETRHTYGVLGEEVNLAAALMQAAAPNTILISESTQKVIADKFEIETLHPLLLKGKSQPIPVFRLLDVKDGNFAHRFYTTPLIGRDEDSHIVRKHLQPVFDGRHAGIIIIHGEAGMGKSRLIYEIEQEMPNVTWFTGQADHLQPVPFHVFSYFLRPYFNQQRKYSHQERLKQFALKMDTLLANSDDALRQDFQLYHSFLAGLVGLMIPESLYEQSNGRIRQENSIVAIKTLIRAEAQQRPVILQIEDAHWLDESSLSAIRHLTYNMGTVPLAIIITSRYRDDNSPFTLSNLGDVPQQSIDLNRLNEDGAKRVADYILSGNVSPALASFINAKADGNPFFVEHLALDLRERGLITQTAHGLELDSKAAIEVPSEITAVLIARLDRLTVQVKAVVQTASVLGREFDIIVLSRMLREEELVYINDAEREAVWSALSEMRYIFRHTLLRDAAYQMQVKERLKDLHRVAAEAIEALYPENQQFYIALAEHWRMADVREKELYYSMLAAEQLCDSSSHQKAIALVQRALTLLPTPDTFPEAAKLSKLIGMSYSENGDMEKARHYYASGLGLFRQHDDWKEVSHHLNLIGLTYLYQSNYDASVVNLEEALQIARKYDYKDLLPEILLYLSWSAGNQLRWDKALPYIDEAMTIAKELNNPRILRNVRRTGSIGWTFALRGQLEEARRIFQENADVALAEGHRSGYAGAIYALGWTSVQLGDWEAAENCYNIGLAYAYELGDSYVLADVLRGQGRVAAHKEEWAKALHWFDQSLYNLRLVGNKRGIADTTAAKWRAYLHLGQPELALQCLHEALRIAMSVRDDVMVIDTLVPVLEFYNDTQNPVLCARIYTFLLHNPNTHGRVLNIVKSKQEKLLPTFAGLHEPLVPPQQFDLYQFVNDLIEA